MEPNKKRRKLLGTLFAGGLIQGCGGGAGGAPTSVPQVELPSGPPPTDGPGVQPVPVSNRPAPSLAALDGQPIFIAHRGAAAIYPEETYTAYDGCVRDGQLFLEGDVYSLADGALAVIHDETVDRTTPETGAVASFTQAKWKNLRVDADNWHGSHFGNQLAAVQFADWVRRYKGSAVLIPEDKDQRSMAGMLAVLAAEGVRKDQVLLQCFGLAPLQKAKAAGYNTCALVTSGGPQGAVAAGANWAGIPLVMTDAETKAWVASGINVLVWTVNRRIDRDAKLTLGVKGFFSDDPAYLSGDAPLFTTDRFDTGTWMPGMLPNTGELGGAARGKFMEGGYWGYDNTSIAYLGCLQGYLCPIKGEAQPKSYSVELSIRFGAVANNDTSRWAAVFIGTDDRQFIDSDEGAAGYHFLFRRNGSIEIYKKVPGKSAAALVAKGGTAFADGDEGRFRIRVDSTKLTVSRMNADGTDAYAATVTDQTYRGAYLNLGRNGLACAFRSLVIK
jgi:glycerophosphoryl diester phosphodiesterase